MVADTPSEFDDGAEQSLIGEIFLQQGKITKAQLAQAVAKQKVSRLSLGAELVKMGLLSEDDVQEALAIQFGMGICLDPVSGPLAANLSKGLCRKVPYTFVKRHLVLPIGESEEAIIVAVNDPLNLEALDDLQVMLGRSIEAVYSPKGLLMEAIRLRYDQKDGAASELLSGLAGQDVLEQEVGELESYDLLDERPGQSAIVRLLNLILSEAIKQGASDIHFEPGEMGLRVRYRIDGVLQDRHAPSQEHQAQLLTRIKVMAQMDIAEHRLPQDGRIKLKMGGRDIDFRVSTVPVVHGERIVLRILDKGNVVLGLEQVGMPEDTYALFRKLVRLPEGIVLVTGPTGSGKTTTLYSAISEINSDEINVMTIEDPVEYKLKGIAQIGVRPKIDLTFSAGLRHILRQDPDVIMVGEIRDVETAEIAIQAALTGHLVLSTLHTNDAPSALTRLVDMGIEPYLLSSTVVGVLAQRLVRTICPDCKEVYAPTAEELADIGLNIERIPDGRVFRGKGCRACFGSGYRGRHGIYELMPVDGPIKQQLVRSADAVELRRLAMKRGLESLRDAGAHLVCRGESTIAEVLRVTRGVEV